MSFEIKEGSIISIPSRKFFSRNFLEGELISTLNVTETDRRFMIKIIKPKRRKGQIYCISLNSVGHFFIGEP